MTTTSLKEICKYIGIRTPFYISSNINKNNSLKGQEKIIDINKCLNSTCYINPIRGIGIYEKERFWQEKIKLKFIKTKDIQYRQFSDMFVKNLSIIDVLMFNSKQNIKKILNNYEFIE